MNRIIIALLLAFTFLNVGKMYSQEDPKELFEKSWTTTDDAEKVSLREKIMEVAPDTEYGMFCKGWFLVQKEDYKSSLEYFGKAIGINDKFWQAYHTRANVYGMLKESEKALADLTSAISINPDYSDSYYVRGATYYSTGDKKKGCQDLSRAASLGNMNAKDLMDKYCK
jgi:tetratricopeptide (TPR) repeat protein